MDFIAFPIHTVSKGWLARSNTPEESILQLLKIMVSTPQRGWHGSSVFGMRDTLAPLHSKHGERLTVIKRMNEALEELEINWVRVEDIRLDPSGVSHELSYILTLSYVGKGTETHRIEV